MGFGDFFSDVLNIGTKKQETTQTEINRGIGSGNTLFGDRSTTYAPVDSRDFSRIDARTFNINSAGASGSVVTTKKEEKIESTPSTSFEKPLSFAPALFGGGTSTATGEASASQGINPTAIAGVVVVGGLAYVLLTGKKKK